MECGSCTLCCELLPIKKLDKKIGEVCKFCTINKGCNIYKERPDECSNFRCAYHQMDKVSEDLRPDNSKIIFEKISDILFFGTVHPDFGITEIAKKQIDNFLVQGFSVLVMSTDNRIPQLFLNQKHKSDDIKNEYLRHLEKLRNNGDT